jgi:hypothetical protein
VREAGWFVAGAADIAETSGLHRNDLFPEMYPKVYRESRQFSQWTLWINPPSDHHHTSLLLNHNLITYRSLPKVGQEVASAVAKGGEKSIHYT